MAKMLKNRDDLKMNAYRITNILRYGNNRAQLCCTHIVILNSNNSPIAISNLNVRVRNYSKLQIVETFYYFK